MISIVLYIWRGLKMKAFKELLINAFILNTDRPTYETKSFYAITDRYNMFN